MLGTLFSFVAQLMHDKHGLLSAPIPLVLRQMTVPMIFGLVAILMFNL
ncbi:MATE family efflux transporter, partial [Vibrio fluvialis]|nr:MATE family efflux transporter [Vibrio fluvialis]